MQLKKLSAVRAILFLLLLIPAAPVGGQTAGSLPVVRVGVILDGPWVRNDEVLDLFRREILELTRGEFDVRFPESKKIQGNWTLEGVSRALDRLLADPEVDLIITVGVLASDNACRYGPLPKPVLAPTVVDPQAQGLPDRDGASGVRNLSYLTLPSTLLRDVGVFQEIVPFSRLTILVNAYIAGSIPELGTRIGSLLAEADVEPVFVPVGASVGEALASIPADAEAVYVYPLLQFSAGAFDSLVSGLVVRGLPSFSFFGEREVRKGILAGLNPDIFPRLSRRVALNVQRVLLGDRPETIPTLFSAGERLIVNTGTAEAIGLYPSWAILTEAELVGGQKEDTAPRLTLGAVMEQAIAANLDLAAADLAVASGAQEVKKSRSLLLPQVDLSAQGLVIDKDRAEASFGSQAERGLTGTATLSQVIFSDPVLANHSVQGHVQRSIEEEREELRLDIAQDAATAYLNVLRAKTFERIQKDNVSLSRTNLELSRVRRAIGQSGPSDVLRWESEIATNRRAAIEANAQRNVAEMALNRIRHRPLEESFQLEDIGVDDPGLLLNDYPYLLYFNNKVSFQALRAYMVEEGLSRSPELRRLDASIAAVKRGYSAATRAFTLPTLALQGSVSQLLATGGAGSDGAGGLPVGDLPEADDTDWSVGLKLSYPLFQGGGKFAERSRAREDLARLQVQRRATAERIEQRIRSAYHMAGSSLAGIQQAFNAAEAARKNLDIVTDSYSRGTVSIIDLLDAQNAYIVADEGAANAVYDFLIDLFEVQRAIDRYDLQMTTQERAEFMLRLEDHMTRNNIRVPRR